MNNVGRSSFGIGQVQKCLFEALTTLKATMVRVNQDGKEASDAKALQSKQKRVLDCCRVGNLFSDPRSVPGEVW